MVFAECLITRGNPYLQWHAVSAVSSVSWLLALVRGSCLLRRSCLGKLGLFMANRTAIGCCLQRPVDNWKYSLRFDDPTVHGVDREIRRARAITPERWNAVSRSR
jgi:hypothetical protein